MTPRSLDPPFGAHAFSGPLESLRRMAALMPKNRLGRICVSAIRRLVVRGRPGPFDVEVFPSVRARLYPASNRCEKRAVAGVQLFDFGERMALREACLSSSSAPFVFVDLGANVGLYSLWMVSVAREANRPFQGLAVEPDPETRARLEDNLAASGASDIVAVAPVAVGETAGRGAIVTHGQNRGEHMVRAAEASDADTVEILTVQEICARHGVSRIDAMKIDLEGHDEGALRGLFSGAPDTLWPQLIVVEAGKGADLPPVVRLCLDNGYRLDRRTRLNALLTRASRPS
ncbi:FkbM family methyltransferase [Stappia stellulata]|uniref:FkbM family methyltransferase n=1 Tax=Stappia stellulata TaxID=71235 RepID=UPI001CD6FB1A|nr:FkbM family methyltransferase [Stappia stellulata]MCA1243255.1 FkbM family methyltransferase [Stappia stellulata]